MQSRLALGTFVLLVAIVASLWVNSRTGTPCERSGATASESIISSSRRFSPPRNRRNEEVQLPVGANEERERGGPSGLVTDESGVPIPGATVSIQQAVTTGPVSLSSLRDAGHAVRTSSLGAWALAPPSYSEAFLLVVRHPEYVSHSQPIGVDTPSPISVVLKRGQSISGRVLIADSRITRAVANVRVVARGRRAHRESLNGNVLAAPQAVVQSSVTDPNGEFTIRGLVDGDYSMELASSVLVQGAKSRQVQGTQTIVRTDRGVVARAGDTNIEIAVLPVVGASLRFVDEDTGLPIPIPLFDGRLPAGWLPWNSSLLAPNQEIVVGSEHSHLGSIKDGSGEYRLAFVPPSWPCSTDTATLGIRSTEYGAHEVRFRVAPLEEAFGSPQVIKLRANRPMGTVVLTLTDAKSNPVSGLTTWLSFRSSRDEYCAHFFKFGADGRSQTVAVPVGKHKLVTNIVQTATEFVEVVEGQPTEVSVRLAGASLAITVVDAETGEPLDGVGVRVGPGHKKVQLDFRKRPGGGVQWSGTWMRPTGLGTFRGLAKCGFSPGKLTLEFYRYGYRPDRKFMVMKAGTVTRVRVEMSPAERNAPWDGWSEVPLREIADAWAGTSD